MLANPPTPDSRVGLKALQAMLRQRHVLAALEVFQAELGDVFQMSLPGFKPVVLAGADANRFVLIDARDDLRWRPEPDPVTKLLRQGLLVVDGDWHDQLRRHMNPAFHRRLLTGYVAAMWRYTDQVCATWETARPREMMAEMRRVALLILADTMYGVDFTPQLDRLWPAVLRMLKYIGPGLWLLWRDIPRPGYTRPRRQIDAYLDGLIRQCRAEPDRTGDNLLSLLVATPGMTDDLIRDQLWTMLIAGHDTSTALLAWTLYELGRHPQVLARAQAEVDRVLGAEPPQIDQLAELRYLGQVIDETLRLYPPAHLGTRIAAVDLEFQGYRIPAGTRVLYSPYLTHRDARYWPNPECFDPERFAPGQSRARPAYAFVPFGGGPRICIGASFAQVEARVVLARLLQKFNLELTRPNVHLHMGVTLEPRPGVMMLARPRQI